MDAFSARLQDVEYGKDAAAIVGFANGKLTKLAEAVDFAFQNVRA
jgi:hypothetical protein